MSMTTISVAISRLFCQRDQQSVSRAYMK